MIPDRFIPLGTWVELYAATDFTPGTRLLVQNKIGIKAVLWEGETPPGIVGGDDHHGWVLKDLGDSAKTTGATNKVWVLFYETWYAGQGRLCVQEYTA